MVDQLPEVRVYVSFVECLEILWKTQEKALESAENKHSNKFPKFLKIFRNLWKSSEISGSLQKKSANVTKCLKQPSSIFYFFKSLEIIRSLQKISEIVAKCLKQPSSIFEFFLNLQKLLEVFGNLQKKSENVRKFSKQSSNTF